MNGDNKYIRSLVEDTRRGSNVAFQELYNLNAGKVFAIALRLTADPEASEQVCKNVFLEVCRNLTDLRAGVPFTLWIKGIAVYMSLEYLRKDTVQDIDGDENNSYDDQRKREKLKLILKDKLDRIITSLPDLERCTFVLHRIENYTLEETADLLKTEESKIKPALQYANQSISEAFSESYVEVSIEEKIKSLSPVLKPPEFIWKDIFNKIRKQKIGNKENNSTEDKLDGKAAAQLSKSQVKSKRKIRSVNNKGIISLIIISLIIVLIILLFLFKP